MALSRIMVSSVARTRSYLDGRLGKFRAETTIRFSYRNAMVSSPHAASQESLGFVRHLTTYILWLIGC